MTAPADKDSAKPSNFLRQIIERDLEQGHYAQRRWSGQPGDAAASRAAVSCRLFERAHRSETRAGLLRSRGP